MTEQEVFTEVTEFLLEQDAKSMRQIGDQEYTAYYGYDGRRCAIGCLIPDLHYHDSLEGKGLNTPDVQAAVGIMVDNPAIFSLLEELREVHDNLPVSEWPQAFMSIAVDHNYAMGYELSFISEHYGGQLW